MNTNWQLRNDTQNPNRRKLKGLYIPLLFILLYGIVLAVYLTLAVNYGSGAIIGTQKAKLLVFVTSPFNPLEDLLPIYGSANIGYIFNLVDVVAIIFAVVFYYHWLSQSKRISPALVFWAGVGATYLFSAISWLVAEKPAGGTSIIGFTMLLFLVGNSLFDTRIYWRIPKTDRTRLISVKYVCVITTFCLSFVFIIPYVVGNASYIAHLAGASLSGLIVALSLKLRKNDTH